MPDLITSATIDTFMGSADQAAARLNLGLGALSTVTPGAGVATILAGASSGTGGPAGTASPTFTGTITAASITASGTTTLNGDVMLGDASTDTITVTGRFGSALLANANNTIDLGSSSTRFRDGNLGRNLLVGGYIGVTAQALSGAGAVNITTVTTSFTSTGVAQALTLANGTVDGQIKNIVHVSRGSGTGTGILTPTTANGFTTVTLTGTGAAVTLQWFTTGGWTVLSSNANATVA